MDYGSLIGRSWAFTWRYRFLWLLGLFAPSAAVSCAPAGNFQWRIDSADIGNLPPEVQASLVQASGQLFRNLDLIVMVGGILLLLLLAVAVASLIAQGGMSHATAQVALGLPVSLGRSWEEGVRLFWRYLLLWVLMILLGLAVVGAVVGIVAGLALLGQLSGGTPQAALSVLATVVGIAAALAAIPFFVVLGVVMVFAQRAIAIENVGPVAGLRIGFRLVMRHLGTSTLAWLVNLALGIGAFLLVAAGIVLMLIPLGGAAAVAYVGAGIGGTLAVVLILAAVLVLLGGWFLSGVANSYFWSYWTLVYLNLTGRLTDRLEVPPAA